MPPYSAQAYWTRTCAPLRAFLAQGKVSWPELTAWRRQHDKTSLKLRNMLAWLEIEGLAEGDRSGWWAVGDTNDLRG